MFDAGSFKEKTERLTDDELLALVMINSRSLVDEAVAIGKAEIEKRGLTSDLQELHFDVFLNAFGFAGRLILLDEQLMFLSTGMPATGDGSGGGLVGGLNAANQISRRVAAENLNFSALDNQGSWIYYLDQILRCESSSSFLAGTKLSFEIKEEDGTIRDGEVRCGSMSHEEVEKLAAKINTAISALKRQKPAA
jgi:hypothetical protein